MKKEQPAFFIWDILYPLLLYYAVTVITMFCMQQVLGTGTDTYPVRKLCCSVIAIPVMYQSFYGKDQKTRGKAHVEEASRSVAFRALLMMLVVVSAACLGVGLNNVLAMSPLMELSAGYAEASSNFYGGTMAIELLSSALATPILEELVYRGIICGRLGRMVGNVPAVVLSALLFALMHFNIVQFLYAFLLGLVLGFYLLKTGCLWMAMIGHMVINGIAVIRTETGFGEWMLDGSLTAWGVTICLLVFGGALLFALWKIVRSAHC